ncbi:hypothetical protein [Streptomyces sp. DH12]|uniref:hypothetical protein n=1 Tax=Streptomyces sp. DH12 TaxID=2857010 RepID=UPI001E46FE9C|nr:hypothetical protein [Streptomyces sp. DH12]
MNKNPTSDAMATAFRAARDSARSAAKAAAHVACLYLIEANGGRGSIHETWRGDGPQFWCKMAAPGIDAHILTQSFGDRAHVVFRCLTDIEYERIRAEAEDRNACYHDEECDCDDTPWPTLAELAEPGTSEVGFRNCDLRGHVTRAAGSSKLDLTLDDEPVSEVAALIRLARADR